MHSETLLSPTWGDLGHWSTVGHLLFCLLKTAFCEPFLGSSPLLCDSNGSCQSSCRSHLPGHCDWSKVAYFNPDWINRSNCAVVLNFRPENKRRWEFSGDEMEVACPVARDTYSPATTEGMKVIFRKPRREVERMWSTWNLWFQDLWHPAVQLHDISKVSS